MNQKQTIRQSLDLIFRGIEGLRAAFPGRRFTIDGRLVGDIGEVVAWLNYDLRLDSVSQPTHDATTEGHRVQIKATFGDSLTFTSVPDMYLGLKLKRDGTPEEIYNGPGSVIRDYYVHRKGIGSKQLSFPISKLQELSRDQVHNRQRIAPRQKTNKGIST